MRENADQEIFVGPWNHALARLLGLELAMLGKFVEASALLESMEIELRIHSSGVWFPSPLTSHWCMKCFASMRILSTRAEGPAADSDSGEAREMVYFLSDEEDAISKIFAWNSLPRNLYDVILYELWRKRTALQIRRETAKAFGRIEWAYP